MYMSSMRVQPFTAFEEAVLKLHNTLVSALKSNMAAISMKTNRGNFFSIFVPTDHTKYTMKLLVGKIVQILTFCYFITNCQ